MDRYTEVHVKPKSCDRLPSPGTIKREKKKKKRLIRTNYARRCYANYTSNKERKDTNTEWLFIVAFDLGLVKKIQTTNSEVQCI